MRTAPVAKVMSRVVALPFDDVDTDQIVPARYLKTTTTEGLGAALFANWRFDTEGKPIRDFPLNAPAARDAHVLVAGRNFGCGSSREHAVWALIGCGIWAVVALSFADIFRGNALKNGLVPVEVDEGFHAGLLAAHSDDPTMAVTVDLEAQRVGFRGGPQASFAIDAFDRRCLLQGIEELDYLASFLPKIETYERARS